MVLVVTLPGRHHLLLAGLILLFFGHFQEGQGWRTQQHTQAVVLVVPQRQLPLIMCVLKGTCSVLKGPYSALKERYYVSKWTYSVLDDAAVRTKEADTGVEKGPGHVERGLDERKTRRIWELWRMVVDQTGHAVLANLNSSIYLSSSMTGIDPPRISFVASVSNSYDERAVTGCLTFKFWWIPKEKPKPESNLNENETYMNPGLPRTVVGRLAIDFLHGL